MRGVGGGGAPPPAPPPTGRIGEFTGGDGDGTDLPPVSDGAAPWAIYYEYQPAPAGSGAVGDFVQIAEDEETSGRPVVRVEPGTMTTVYESGNEYDRYLHAEVDAIPATGREESEVITRVGGESEIPVLRIPQSADQLELYGLQSEARTRAAAGRYTVPLGDERLQFGFDLSPVDVETPGGEHVSTVMPLGEAPMFLNCVVSGTCFTFSMKDGDLVRTDPSTPGVAGNSVPTFQHLNSELLAPVPDDRPTPQYTWILDPDEGIIGRTGPVDSPYPDSVAVNVVRTNGLLDAARVTGGTKLGSLGFAPPPVPPWTDSSPTEGTWETTVWDQARSGQGRAVAPSFDLRRHVDDSGNPVISGHVLGVSVAPTGGTDARRLTELSGIPSIANPLNYTVDSSPGGGIQVSNSTLPEFTISAEDNSLTFGRDGQRYRLAPNPTEGSGVSQWRDGAWVPADPAAVPSIVGLWRRPPPEGGTQPDGADRDGGSGTGGSPDAAPTTDPVGGATVAPDPQPRPDLDDLREQTFPGGSFGGADSMTDPLWGGAPPQGRGDTTEFDPNRSVREREAAQVPPVTETFPDALDRELEELLWPDGPGLFLGAPVSERDQVPDRPPVGGGVRSGDRVGSVGGSGLDGVAEFYSAGVGVGSAAGEASAGAGGSRVNSNGRRAVLVGSQVLVGDGRPGTSRGRVDFFRDAGGVMEAVVSSPRRVDGGDGTTSVWVPNLGVSVASNVGAGGVTSVQRVESARFPVGASSQVVRLRTGEFTQVLAGGGEGSVPGSVSYRPVVGDPRVQDVVVSPSVTEVVDAGGGTTVTYSGLVPVNRRWNPLGAPERFRVAVGTQMREVQRRVVVAAPARVSEPVYEPAGGGAYEGVEEPVYQRSFSGGVELSPVLVPSRRPVSRPSVQVPAVRVPAVQPVPVRAPEPSWQDRAGRVAGQVGEGLVWTAVLVGGVVVWVLTGGGAGRFAP
ncbi:MAG: hypothetical protein LH603_16155 [Pseudonocardia sp.]|nr:hypothetical protein [Pseudonocardia sp.]